MTISTLAEVSIVAGLVCHEYEQQVKYLMDNRLAVSSQSSIQTALRKWWRPFCTKYNLEFFVPTGCAERGGIMASFVLAMSKSLMYGTITGYVWCVVDEHISNGYASPLANVRDWTQFMNALEVEIHTPSEPRRMFPWLLFIKVLKNVDMNEPEEVAVALFMVMLFFLISRPELLPLALTGENKFDPGKHLRFKDIKFDKGYGEVCMRAIKQDPLCKRKTHVMGESWRAIGKCKVHLLSFENWYKLYTNNRKYRDRDSPFFQDSNGNPLTYARANRRMRAMITRVADSATALLHSSGGLRVLARNAVAGVAGDDTAKIQGMWGVCVDVYDRPMLERVLTLPDLMLEYINSAAMPARGCLESVEITGLQEDLTFEDSLACEKPAVEHEHSHIAESEASSSSAPLAPVQTTRVSQPISLPQPTEVDGIYVARMANSRAYFFGGNRFRSMRLAMVAKNNSEGTVPVSVLPPQLPSPTVSKPVNIPTMMPAMEQTAQFPVALYVEELTVEKDQPPKRTLNAVSAHRDESGPMTPAKAKVLRNLT